MSWTRRTVGAAALMALAACASVSRVEFTKGDDAAAVIPGIPGARMWTDDLAAFHHAQDLLAAKRHGPFTLLALSGGGSDVAFGAGLLSGWSETGTRPQFAVVTGTSAGALIAPFAFLGPAYDPVMKAVFTDGETEGFLQVDALGAIFGSAIFKSKPLQELVARHVDERLLAAIAAEHRKGRRLFVVTTNLDAQRTSVWNMGLIAASRRPDALALFRNIMVASASIPGVFSPVALEVESGGKRFAEMHVDGGVTANVLVVPQALLLSNIPAAKVGMRPRLYVIINDQMTPAFDLVKPATLPIVERAFITAVKENTRNSLIATQDFARRNGWELNVAAIDPSYPGDPGIDFDTAYMRQLFKYGYDKGHSPRIWQKDALETPADGQVAAQLR
jgi:predicted patatin/cPLA2 family phospholipase